MHCHRKEGCFDGLVIRSEDTDEERISELEDLSKHLPNQKARRTETGKIQDVMSRDCGRSTKGVTHA